MHKKILDDEYISSEKLIIDLSKLLLKGRKYVFRGFRDDNQMNPGIIRKGFEFNEINILRKFMKYSLPYVQYNNPVDFVACAQHYGVSTRLLDFTFNPFVALYFALHSEKKKEEWHYIRLASVEDNFLVDELPVFFDLGDIGSNYNIVELYKVLLGNIENLFNEQHISQFEEIYSDLNIEQDKDNSYLVNYLALVKNKNNIIDEKFIELGCEKVKNKRIIFVNPNFSNNRMIMQQGLFMFPYSIKRDEHKKIIERNTELIKISPSIRHELITYLKGIGVATYKLMPDLIGACQASIEDF